MHHDQRAGIMISDASYHASAQWFMLRFCFISFESVDCVSLCYVITMLAHPNLALWLDWLSALSRVVCIFLWPSHTLLDAPQPISSSSYFQHQARSKLPIFFVALDRCSGWTPKLRVPNTNYTQSFVEHNSVTSQVLVLSALNFLIICGSERNFPLEFSESLVKSVVFPQELAVNQSCCQMDDERIRVADLSSPVFVLWVRPLPVWQLRRPRGLRTTGADVT